jgi:hypothetical protein
MAPPVTVVAGVLTRLRIIDFEDHVAQELARASLIPQRRWLRWSTLILAALLGLGLLVTLVEHRLWWLALALGALTLLSGAGLAYYGGLYRKQNRLRGQLQAGLKGQRLLTTVLACLDDSYYLINNLKLPGRADDVDHLLVGPNGIFALETKHHRGRIFCHNGQWYQSKMSRGGHLQPDEPIRDPVQQLKRNVDYLRTCINHTDRTLSKRTGLWIEGAVVFTHPSISPRPCPFPCSRSGSCRLTSPATCPAAPTPRARSARSSACWDTCTLRKGHGQTGTVAKQEGKISQTFETSLALACTFSSRWS